MERKIIISNLKGIGHLEFTFPDKKGVYLLVGANGTGKTTLMTCMHRIGNNYAFARGFRQPKSGSSYDSFANSSIEYVVNDSEKGFNESAIYTKKKERWLPMHRNPNVVFTKFGFSETFFLAANSKRIEPKSDELEDGIIVSIDSNVIETLNHIFGTTKFNNLAKLVLRSSLNLGPKENEEKTKGKAAIQVKKYDDGFYVINNDGDYYSEKRFSTGELAIIKLVNHIIKNAKKDALILIDEIEMALHPLVQIQLLYFLNNISKDKNLTIIVGTHSPSLIKRVKKEQIILLSQDVDDSNTIVVNTPCYAARALGYVDFEESARYDYIFFVEDDMARFYLLAMIRRFQEHNKEHFDAKISVVPVGGYPETARLAVNTKLQLFPDSKVYALLDDDAFNADKSPKNRIADLYRDYSNIIGSLNITPEVHFVQMLSSNNLDLAQEFKREMNCNLTQVLASQKYISVSTGSNPRKVAKDQFEVIINVCKNNTVSSIDIIKEKLITLIAQYETEEQLKALLSQRFNADQVIK